MDLLIVLLGVALTAGYFMMAGYFAYAWSGGSEFAGRRYVTLFLVIYALAIALISVTIG